ncbi:MAG: HTH-type transcriptional regulator NimR [Herbaspirillum frisingense]|uniref:HTH-type transcriptional regulator NimR n=1 Tax=Herbaspirillum frisingense TaxID=92645 RepID=A0A7V8FX26_9BURK|nr:MAG: HTH-type transcriptional regulator NimR [Herbaspirillum frisingense]
MISSLVFAQEVHHPAGRSIAHHDHGEGQLLLVLKGTATITAEEGFWLTPPGFAIWIPAGCSHGARYSKESSLINIRFDARLCEGQSADCTLISVSDLMRHLAHEAVHLAASGDRSDAQELVARLMVHQMGHHWNGTGLFVPHGRDRRLRQAIDILRKDPGLSLQLEELAQRSATSGRTLARLFMKETGMSFRRWRDYFCVVCAIDRLAQGQSITQTALELGYQSASSFTTLFTRLLGHPPKRYLRMLEQARNGD